MALFGSGEGQPNTGSAFGNLLFNEVARKFSPDLYNEAYNEYQLKQERAWNEQQAEIARQFSAGEAQKQREFEERMSSTAYSRAAADLKNAGYNPYLAAMGNSASTPSGAVGSSFQASSAGRNKAVQHTPGALEKLINSSFELANNLIKNNTVRHYGK